MTYEVGGSLSYDTPNYVVRRADAELYAGLKAGKFCYVLNARQMGKSSLLVRTKHRLEQVGFRCAAIDMTGIGSEIVTPLQWYKGVVSELWLELGLLGKLDLKTWWRDEDDLSILQRLSRFINDLLWVHFPQDRLVIFVDEIDCSLSLDFPVDDFFGLIRFCYNQRALNPDYHRITFALFGAATPSDLIRDKIRTSFNIGQAIELQGFRPEEAQPLARELSLRTDDAQTVLRAVLNWTGGQPFLTQKLCQLVVNSVEAKHRTQQSSPQSTDQLAHASRLRIPPDAEEFWVESVVRSRILAHWESQDEPEHLRTIRDRLQRNQQWLGRLLSIYQQVLLFEQVGGDGEAGEAGGKAGRDGGEELTPKSKIQSPKSKIQNPKSKILPVFADDSREQIELLLSGLVVKDRGRLKVKNRIYREVFNLEWVDNQLAALRPYSQAF
ncbi:MAG: AAA-like domain-containing protein, partial [Pseudanabaenales cyanobacterium]|nr:AAA-like domain-containing protein [Pseudanabaenales cyanobacterium]